MHLRFVVSYVGQESIFNEVKHVVMTLISSLIYCNSLCIGTFVQLDTKCFNLIYIQIAFSYQPLFFVSFEYFILSVSFFIRTKRPVLLHKSSVLTGMNLQRLGRNQPFGNSLWAEVISLTSCQARRRFIRCSISFFKTLSQAYHTYMAQLNNYDVLMRKLCHWRC